MLDLGRLEWVINELVASTKVDSVIPRAKVLKALLAIYLITARYSPVRVNIIKVSEVVMAVVM